MFHDKKLRNTIDLYMRGVLSPEAKAAFEKDLETNPEVRKTYNAWSDIMGGFRRQIDENIRDGFRDKGLEMEIAERDTVTMGIFMKVGIIVGVAVAVLALALAPGYIPDNWPFG